MDKLPRYRGTLYVYSGDKLVASFHNQFVLTGRMFALDALWGNGADWISGGSWGPRYAALGDSVVADGVAGPGTYPNGIDVGGGWNGPSIYDYKLDNEITISRPQISVSRTERTVEIEVTFNDSHFTANPPMVADVDVYEMGLFLSNTVQTPTANPATEPAQKQNAMLSRIIFYTEQDQKLYARPVTKFVSQNLTMRYVFEDV